MSSSFDSGGPRNPDNLPFGWIVVDGEVVLAANYWKARAEVAEGKLKKEHDRALEFEERLLEAERKLAAIEDWSKAAYIPGRAVNWKTLADLLSDD